VVAAGTVEHLRTCGMMKLVNNLLPWLLLASYAGLSARALCVACQSEFVMDLDIVYRPALHPKVFRLTSISTGPAPPEA
jgi:hypothetical protein